MKVAARRWIELLGSMRFAITLLVVIALASIIGTIVLQNQSYASYQIEFGTFWFRLFVFFGLFDIYHATWFIVLLGALCCSTSICVYRHTPAMIHAMRYWRPASAPRVLENMPYTFAWTDGTVASLDFLRLKQNLISVWGRFASKKEPRENLLVLRWGAAYRWGYILTHLGIVLICLGGLLDSDLLFKWKAWSGLVVPETRDIPISQISSKSRLDISNPSYRAQVNIVEGGESANAFINVEEGYFLQALPFNIKLDRFHVEYHPTGQPKAFISDVTITSPNGKIYRQSLEVNKPFQLGSVSVYQSSFGDGGTGLAIRPVSLFGQDVQGIPNQLKVFNTYGLPNKYTLEVTDFKPINVESNPSKPINKENESKQTWRKFFEATPKDRASQVINMGPAWTYRYRDTQGQAREYHNYLQPILLEGKWYLVTGMRDAMDQPFRYMRFPLTPEGYVEPYFLWRLYFLDSTRWMQWADQFSQALSKQNNASGSFAASEIHLMAKGVLALFSKGGYDHVAAYLNKQVPAKDQQRIGDLYIRILNQLAFESYQSFYRDFPAWQAKMPAPYSEAAQFFIRDALLSMSDSFLYGSPFYLQATQLDPIQSSGFQVTRSPGKAVVYGGCLILVVGTFLLFYWRETRLWCDYRCKDDGSYELRLSMNSNRLDSLTKQRFQHYCEWVNDQLRESNIPSV